MNGWIEKWRYACPIQYLIRPSAALISIHSSKSKSDSKLHSERERNNPLPNNMPIRYREMDRGRKEANPLFKMRWGFRNISLISSHTKLPQKIEKGSQNSSYSLLPCLHTQQKTLTLNPRKKRRRKEEKRRGSRGTWQMVSRPEMIG